MGRSYWISRGAVSAATIAFTLMFVTIPSVEASGEKVLPVDAVVHGNTYGEWAARWWQWMLSIPGPVNPNVDPNGENCGQEQAGPVWFLAGTFGGGPFVRTCKIPAGKPVFVPIINTAFGSGAFDCDPTVPGVACNLAQLRKAAAEATDKVELEAILNGRSLKGLHEQRVQSPAFPITYPKDSVLGVPEGTYAPNVTDGYWLMLDSMPVGVHTLRVRGKHLAGVFKGTIIDVTWTLTIAAP
jgi:hypothetical protein